jgi:diguanylate cyclase (GGDEF)-like protein/PAS domain S-box-containing protein
LAPTAIDPTPMVMSVTGVFFLMALLQFQLLDVAPIARHLVIETMRDGVIVLDYKGRLADINPAARKLLGEQNTLAVGKTIADHLDHLPEITRMLKEHNSRTVLERVLQGLENRFLEINFVPIFRKQGKSTDFFAGQIIAIRDVTERKQFQDEIQRINTTLKTQLEENEKLRARLEEIAIRDSLTGLYNRRYLDEMIEKEIARAERGEYSVSVLMLDIDNFKHMNDRYGHKAGDAVLVTLGQFLPTFARMSDFVCRYGGEEFILVMPGLNQHDALRRAQEICQAVYELEVRFDAQPLKFTISIGVALYPDHGDTPDDVIRAADSALYEAKRNGRNQALLTQGSQIIP